MNTLKNVGKFFTVLALTIGLFTVAGCGATKPASASFASVIINGHTVSEVRNAAGEVFQADGYTVMVRGNEMKFEKEGTRMAQLVKDQLG